MEVEFLVFQISCRKIDLFACFNPVLSTEGIKLELQMRTNRRKAAIKAARFMQCFTHSTMVFSTPSSTSIPVLQRGE